ncbi:Uncharacterised protein [Yersinia frederiksenii]|nr:Uncharacterised protein [Yersinia frederiksenii]CNH56744.1 Uncharacterised protein [Yersinia frederiksenii]CNH60311.1 Uncharacterised protein [Yersinia frederiksenii]
MYNHLWKKLFKTPNDQRLLSHIHIHIPLLKIQSMNLIKILHRTFTPLNFSFNTTHYNLIY